jgi:hypothetical protein
MLGTPEHFFPEHYFHSTNTRAISQPFGPQLKKSFFVFNFKSSGQYVALLLGIKASGLFV